jgi:hypothetical protein
MPMQIAGDARNVGVEKRGVVCLSGASRIPAAYHPEVPEWKGSGRRRERYNRQARRERL